MKTIKVLGIGRIPANYNGVSVQDYYKALATVSKYWNLAPYVVETAISEKQKTYNTCPDCGITLYETMLEPNAPRDETNHILPFEQGKYKCRECCSKTEKS